MSEEIKEVPKQSLTVQRALVELKLLDDRINKKIGTTKFVGSAVGDKLTLITGETKDSFEKDVKANTDSIFGLINRRAILKSAITVSNATTPISIFGQTVSVATAIDRKNSIGYEVALLNKMRKDYAEEIKTIERNNAKMEDTLSKLTSDRTSSEKSKIEEINQLQESYRKLNETKLYDVLGIVKEIENLSNNIAGFQSEVDLCLSESNNTTYIEI